LEGEIEIEMDNQKRLLRAGELVVIPGGMEHTAYVGPRPTRILDIFSPAREDMKY
jgi:quercetin dioxygenase-like cupin family protein